jgi:alpha-1,6-mannosyl-glycoprotein beta-1,2-N-acetylglucosaminyltransferase
LKYDSIVLYIQYPSSFNDCQVLHKFLTPKPRNNSHAVGATNASDAAAAGQNGAANGRASLNISEIRRNIERYNDMQQVLNEELFGPVQNDSLIIVVQVRLHMSYFCS